MIRKLFRRFLPSEIPISGHENARATRNTTRLSGDGPGSQRPIVRKRTRTDHGRAPFGEGAKARAREAVLGGQGTNQKEQDKGRESTAGGRTNAGKISRGRLAQDGLCDEGVRVKVATSQEISRGKSEAKVRWEAVKK